MATISVEKTIEIEAPAAKIWEQLIDVKSWASWKPFVKKARIGGGHEHIGLGSNIKMSLLVGSGVASAPLSVTVVEFDAPRALAWEGGVKGLVHAIHGFELKEGQGKTVVVSRETFTGALLSLMTLLVSKQELEDLHEAWLKAIKARVTGKGSVEAAPGHGPAGQDDHGRH